jgi:hypothetical protein
MRYIKINLQTILAVDLMDFITACRKDQNAVPNITGTNILSGLPNSAITIKGNFFDTKLSDYTVTINGTPATVNSVNASRLVVMVPAKATAGKIIITVGSTTLTYPSDFKPILNQLPRLLPSALLIHPSFNLSLPTLWEIYTAITIISYTR